MEYKELLEKAKKEMPEIVQEKQRFEIPKVKGHIQGNKTMISNLNQIASHIHRPIEHMFKYLLKELATPGEIREGMAIFGRKVSSLDLNNKIKQYADEYLFCKQCGKPDTELSKEENMSFVKCMVCGTKNPVRGLI